MFQHKSWLSSHQARIPTTAGKSDVQTISLQNPLIFGPR